MTRQIPMVWSAEAVWLPKESLAKLLGWDFATGLHEL